MQNTRISLERTKIMNMDTYAIYLRKSRADLAARKGFYINKILRYGNLRYAKRRERGIAIVGKKKKSS